MRTFKHLFLVFIISFGFFTTAQPQEPVFASACISVGTPVHIATADGTTHYQVTTYDAQAITNLLVEHENGQAVKAYQWSTVKPGEVLVDMWLSEASLMDSPFIVMQVDTLGGVVGCSSTSSFTFDFTHAVPEDPNNGG